MRRFVGKVIEQQQLRGMNGKQFAAFLGVDPADWSRVKNGHRRPSISFVLAVLARWPELAHYLANDTTEGSNAA